MPTFAQDITVSGSCKEFDIIIQANLDGCWDAKVDAPAVVLHPDGWKSSFFYVNNELCAPRTQTKLKIMLGTKYDIIATLKLRQNDTIIEKDFAINQSCPIELSNQEFLLVVATIIIILALGIVIYLKPKKKDIKRKRKKKLFGSMKDLKINSQKMKDHLRKEWSRWLYQ